MKILIIFGICFFPMLAMGTCGDNSDVKRWVDSANKSKKFEMGRRSNTYNIVINGSAKCKFDASSSEWDCKVLEFCVNPRKKGACIGAIVEKNTKKGKEVDRDNCLDINLIKPI